MGTARLDPLQSERDKTPRYRIPANATAVAPPSFGVNQKPVWDGRKWTVVADHRGEVWYDPSGGKHEITVLGVTPDPSWVTELPPPTAEELLEQKRIAALKELDDERLNARADDPDAGPAVIAWKEALEAIA